MTRARRAILAVLAVTAGGAAAWWRAGRGDALPPRLRLEHVTQDLLAGFAPADVAHEPAAGAVRVDRLQPSPDGRMHGSYRRALVTPPPALLRFRVRVPPESALRFAVGVDGPGKRNRHAAGVRFTARIEGREVFARTVNPARTRHDRAWFEGRVDLAPWRDREVEMTFATEATGSGAPAGTPGWSHLRIVRETWRDRQRPQPGAPNVLVLLVDSLRADQLGCYGADPSPSPTLDRLAARGRLYEHALAQSSWTLVSVASLFTGLHARSHGVFGVPRRWAAPPGAHEEEEWGFLPDALPTLAEHVQAAGITTVGVSTNPLVSGGTNLARGFETFTLLEEPLPRDRWVSAARVNETFLRWLRANRGLRFFAYLHYMDVHAPYTPPPALWPPAPPEVRPSIAAGSIDGLAPRINGGHKPPLRAVEATFLRTLYDLEVRTWDAALGTLLRGLEDLGLAESTVVIVTADHGEEFQEHGRLQHGSHLYEESIRVPLVVAGPGLLPGRVVEPVQGIDLFPTVASCLGFDPPGGLPGRNLLAPAAARPVLSETRSGILPDGAPTEVVSVRTADWKLIHTPALGRYELYDLGRDPGERTDRFGEVPEGNALVAALAGWQAPPPPRGDGGDQDPRLVEKLRALGYVE